MLSWKKLYPRQKVLLAIPLLLVCLVLVVILHQRYWRLWSIPDVGEPFDTESFLKQYENVNVQENAFDFYRGAHGQLDRSVELDDWKVFTRQAANWMGTRPESKTWLEASRPALELWLMGTEKTTGFEHPPHKSNYNTLLPLTQDYHYFSRLALLESSRLRAAGNLDQAWEMHRAVLRGSAHIRNGFPYSWFIGSFIYSSQMELFAYLLADENMTVELLEQIAKEHQQICDSYPDLSIPLKFHYIGRINQTEVMSDEAGTWAWLVNERSVMDRVQNILFQNRFAYYELPRWERPETEYVPIPESVKKRSWLLEYLMKQILSPKKPNWKVWQSAGYVYYVVDTQTADATDLISADQIEESANRLGVFKQFLDSPLTTEFSDIDRYDRALMEQKISQLQIHLHLYHHQQGEFPERLEQLVPIYLAEIPVDPFNEGRPVQYRRENVGALIWSWGRDEKDDNGVAAEWNKAKTEKGDLVYRVFPPGTKPSRAPVNAEKPELKGPVP